MKEGHRSATILLIDDDPGFLASIADTIELTNRNFTVLRAGNGLEGLEILKAHQVHIIVTDLLMPEMDGMELLETLHREPFTTPVIVVTAIASDSTRRKLRRFKPLAIIEKPVDLDRFMELIQTTADSIAARSHSSRFALTWLRLKTFAIPDSPDCRHDALPRRSVDQPSAVRWWIPLLISNGGC